MPCLFQLSRPAGVITGASPRCREPRTPCATRAPPSAALPVRPHGASHQPPVSPSVPDATEEEPVPDVVEAEPVTPSTRVSRPPARPGTSGAIPLPARPEEPPVSPSASDVEAEPVTPSTTRAPPPPATPGTVGGSPFSAEEMVCIHFHTPASMLSSAACILT